MKLLIRASQEAALAKRKPFRLSQERDVGGRQFVRGSDFDQGVRKSAAHCVHLRAGPGEKARPGHRREWYCHLKLGVVIAARALERFSPAMVEDIFSARVRFHITGSRSQKVARRVFGQQM